jgi:FdhD protein
MLLPGDEITGVDYEEDISTIVVRTAGKTDFEEKLKKKTMTSGCAQGTVFGDVMEKFETVTLPTDTTIKTSWLYSLMKKINTMPSLYLEAGAIHGCVLAKQDKVLLYMEDVGRHNAIDKIAGYMFKHGIDGGDKIFYTTGRLTSEMVIKAVQMGIPILASRSGFTAWGVDLARQVGLTLIGRARGKRFVVLSGAERIVYDQEARSGEAATGTNKDSDQVSQKGAAE